MARFEDVERIIRLVLALAALGQVVVKLLERKRKQRDRVYHRRSGDSIPDSADTLEC